MLWWSKLNESSNPLTAGSDATQTTFSQNFSNGTMFGGLNEAYSTLQTYSTDKFNNSNASNDKVVTDDAATTSMRYIRLTSNGSNMNASNHLIDLDLYTFESGLVEVVNVVDYTSSTTGTVVSGTVTAKNAGYYNTSSVVAFDLGSEKNVLFLNLRRYYADSRTYYGQKIEYSLDGTTWYTYWDSHNNGSFGNHNATNLYAETSSGRDFFAGQIRTASLNELENSGQSDLRCFASQLVAVLAGRDQTEFFEYWTRDFGQQLGCGTYVTSSGEVMKNTWMTKRKGVRFCMTMSEGCYDRLSNVTDLKALGASARKFAYTTALTIRATDTGIANGSTLFEIGGKVHLELFFNERIMIDYISGIDLNDVKVAWRVDDGSNFTGYVGGYVVIVDAVIRSGKYVGEYSFIDFNFNFASLGNTDEELQQLWDIFSVNLLKFTYEPPR